MKIAYKSYAIQRKEEMHMKVCNNCGATLKDTDSFCTGCGAAVPAAPTVYTQNSTNIKEPVSVGGWIGRSLIPLIPIVGGIVYLIMLFIWSGDSKKEDTFRNWAKAQLIVMAVTIVLSIILGIVLGATLSEVFESLY